MTRLNKYARGALVGLALASGACQGELKFVDGGNPSGQDLRQPDLSTPTADGVSFADINRDLDQPNFGCTVQSAGCHGPGTTAPLVLQSGASGSMAALMANYKAVVKEVDLQHPESSNLLLKPLVKPGITHTGSKVMDPSMKVYTRWLQWIELGAHFEFHPFSELKNPGGGDLAQPADLAAPGDMSRPADLGDGGK